MIHNPNEFQALQRTSLKLLDHFCNKSINSNDLLDDYLLSLVSDNLSSTYRVIERQTKRDKLKGLQKVNLKKFEPNEYSSDFLSPVIDLYDLVNSSFSDIFDVFCIHGSISSLDYKEGWSDLDTFAIVNKNITFSSSGLMKLREAVKKINKISKDICCLQHHGVNLQTPYELFHYDQSNLPLEIFKEFKALTNDIDQIEVNYSGLENNSTKRLKKVLSFLTKAYQEGILKTHAYNNKYLEGNYKNADDSMYQFKYYLEQFTLLPALYLGSINQFHYKKDAITEIKKHLSSQTTDFIDNISYIRSEWPSREGVLYVPNKIPNWIREIIPSNYFEIGHQIAHEILLEIENR